LTRIAVFFISRNRRASLGVQRRQHDDDVARPKQRIEIEARHRRQAGQVGVAAGVVLQLRAEGRQPARGLAADLAEADESDGLAAKLACPQRIGTRQGFSQQRLGAVEIVERAEDEQNRRLGHAGDVLLGLGVGDDDRALGRRRQIDAFGAGDGRDDGAEPGRRHKRGARDGKIRGAEQDIGVRQRIGRDGEGFAVRVAGDVMPGLLQVGADLVEHRVVGVPADDGDIHREISPPPPGSASRRRRAPPR
jgi:hypothetical protein